MSSTRDKRAPGGVGDAATPWLILGLIAFATLGPWSAMWLAARFGPAVPPAPNPLLNTFELVREERSWSTGATIAAVVLAVLLLVLVVAGLLLVAKLRGRSANVDRASQHMGRGRDVHELSRRSASRYAVRLGASKDHPGLPLGRAVAGGQPLFSNWESTIVDIWGTRTGKTTSMGIPSILAAPGTCVVTSNKRDVVDATRGPRGERGQVWVFDTQQIVGERPSWWWNPLSFVTSENRAAELAGHFGSASWKEGSRSDPFWENSGEDLLAGLLLAAAVAGRPISQVSEWLVSPSEDEPVRILTDPYPRVADRVRGIINTPAETRGGIYSNAQQMARCLNNQEVLEWIEPPRAGEHKQEFVPARFVRGPQTLYSLSKEGRGTAAGVVTALTAAVIEAATDYATEQPSGRLSTPMVAVLDEAANVCRWAELPSLYSHFGSRGIVLRTILQSWSQGVDVWGQSGMRKLWSAANVKTYGGGVAETDFLRDLSEIIGDYDRVHASVSHSRGQRSLSRDVRSERILDVADLAALPKGRAVVIASGSKPTLVHTVPWMQGPHAAAVQASIDEFDPEGTARGVDVTPGDGDNFYGSSSPGSGQPDGVIRW